MRLALFLLLLLPALAGAAEKDALRMLTTADEVRALSPEEAQRGYPVRLRGVVLCERKFFILQDETSPIYVTSSAGAPVVPGDSVEVEGVSGAGEFAPQVQPGRVRRLGRQALPPPERVTYAELTTGRWDAHFVELAGIVRAARALPEEPGSTLDLVAGGDRFTARLWAMEPEARLVDAEVRVRGICFYLWNRQRQFFGARLATDNREPVTVERPAPAEPWAAEVRPFASLLRFTPTGASGHRVRVQGRVSWRGEGSLYLDDGARGLQVQCPDCAAATLGQALDVLGFPEPGEYSPMLHDAVFRPLPDAAGGPPRARAVTAEAAPEHDSELVQIEAALVRSDRVAGGWQLLLQSGSALWGATLASAAAPPPPAGSRVALTGVCAVLLGDIDRFRRQKGPASFRLLLRSADDLAVLTRPPWWTAQRLLTALALAAGAATLALVWAVVLRRTVARQTRVIGVQLEREAVHGERTRIAREFHDTLEQHLAAIGIQLDAVDAAAQDAGPPVRELVGIAREIARHSREEARHAIWDLRSPTLGRGDFSAALDRALRPLAERAGLQFSVAARGEKAPLPARLEHHLLRVAQEALTNVIKHAAATRVGIETGHTAEEIILRIADDGRGFDPAATAGADAGHFGLCGMRERVDRLDGTLEIATGAGRGVTLTVRLPLAAA